jgi:protein pelota
MFRAQNVSERKKDMELVEKVREVGSEVKIFSNLHMSGEQLDQLSGLCSILRFLMQELEYTDDSDSD